MRFDSSSVGLITAIAGVIAKEYGPVVGGLFLAFPAIFPASATLIEKHEKRKKENEGLQGTERGREAASVDAGVVQQTGHFSSSQRIMFTIPFALQPWESSEIRSTDGNEARIQKV